MERNIEKLLDYAYLKVGVGMIEKDYSVKDT